VNPTTYKGVDYDWSCDLTQDGRSARCIFTVSVKAVDRPPAVVFRVDSWYQWATQTTEEARDTILARARDHGEAYVKELIDRDQYQLGKVHKLSIVFDASRPDEVRTTTTTDDLD
jgi:hypothetical protein